jgi:hypothetical protein
VAGPTVRRIRLTYPAGDLSSLASNKKYGGKCVFDGTVRRNY